MVGSKSNISEEKAKRIAVGATVAGVVLIMFLLVILVIQFVQIGVRNAERKRIEEQIAHYQQMLEDGQMTLEEYLEGIGIYLAARNRGWGASK